LGFPAVVLPDDEFNAAIKVIDLSIIGIFRKVDHISNFISVRRSKEGSFKQPLLCDFYIGYYDGSIRFCDGESTGIEVFTLEELQRRIQETPSDFADDLSFMLKRYKEYLVPIRKEDEFVLGYEE